MASANTLISCIRWLAVFVVRERLVQPLTSFCQHQPEEISCMSVSCFPSGAQPQSITVPAPVQAGRMRGWVRSGVGDE